ncbi:MAG: restriction endonuclease subunit S [Planctomycetota bacterium]
MTNLARFSTLTIEEATERLIDYRGKTPPKTDSGIRLITAKVVKGGQIHDDPAEYIAADFYDEWMRRGLPQKLDVLLTTEAPLGEVAILRDDARIALAQRIILLRAKPELLDPLYLFYALQSDFGQGELRARASGTTVLGIKQSELRKVRIPVFPLPIQRRIAGILSAYDELIENSQRRIKILESMARGLYREWFVHFRFPGHESVPRVKSPLGEIPEGWEVKAFSQLASYVNGYPFKPAQLGKEGKPIIKIKELKAGIVADTPRNPGEDIPEKYNIRDGDVLFSWSADLDAYLWMGGEGLLNQHLFTVLPADGISLAFCFHALKEAMPRFRALSLGATMHHIKRSALDQVFTVVAPMTTRKRFDVLVEPIHKQLITLTNYITNLRRTRDLLLPRLLSGQIDVEAMAP